MTGRFTLNRLGRVTRPDVGQAPSAGTSRRALLTGRRRTDVADRVLSIQASSWEHLLTRQATALRRSRARDDIVVINGPTNEDMKWMKEHHPRVAVVVAVLMLIFIGCYIIAYAMGARWPFTPSPSYTQDPNLLHSPVPVISSLLSRSGP
jgi:hypothetical protein